jgi:hypothetical protein
VDYQINTNCKSKSKSDITLIFESKVEEKKPCIVRFKDNITCQNLTYGMIDNYPKNNYSRVFLQVLIILLMDIFYADKKMLLYQEKKTLW